MAGSIITAHRHIPHLNPPLLIPGYIALAAPQYSIYWSDDTIWAPANNVATLLLAPGLPGIVTPASIYFHARTAIVP